MDLYDDIGCLFFLTSYVRYHYSFHDLFQKNCLNSFCLQEAHSDPMSTLFSVMSCDEDRS